MLFKEITILNQNFEIEHDMYVGTKDDRIIYIGKDTPMEDFGPFSYGSHEGLW